MIRDYQLYHDDDEYLPTRTPTYEVFAIERKCFPTGLSGDYNNNYYIVRVAISLQCAPSVIAGQFLCRVRLGIILQEICSGGI